MKRVGWTKFLIFSLIVMSTSCKEEVVMNEQTTANRTITMTASDFLDENESRTAINIGPGGGAFTWADKDTVGIFPDEGAQAYFPMVNGAGTKSAVFTGGGWALKNSFKYVAYFPYNFFNRSLDKISVDYCGQVQYGDASTAHLGNYDFMAAAANTPSNNNVNFAFKHLGAVIEMNVCIPKKGDVSQLKLIYPAYANGTEFIEKGIINLADAVPAVKGVTTSKNLIVRTENFKTSKDYQNVKIYFMMAPRNLKGVNIQAEVINNGVICKGYVLNGMGEILPGKAYKRTIELEDRAPLANSYHVATAGTLPKLVGDKDKFDITEMKVSGNLNGTDIRFIREMAGRDVNGKATQGKLTILDMYDAKIVSGGVHYLYHGGYIPHEIATSNDVIGMFMFSECKSLKYVVLPKTIKKIDRFAFKRCDKMETLSMPNSVTSIGEEAFNECKNLQNITLPTELLIIDRFAFSNCHSLPSLEIPNKVREIQMRAFGNCKSLKVAKLPNSLKTMDEQAYSESGIAEVTIPGSLTDIPGNCFSNCYSLKTVSLSEGLKRIHYGAFSTCTKMNANLELPASLEQIDSDVFLFSNVKNLYLKNTLVEVKAGLLRKCNQMSIYLPNTIKKINKQSLPLSGYNIYCQTKVPPLVDPDNSYPDELHIPVSGYQAYEADAFWTNSSSIITFN